MNKCCAWYIGIGNDDKYLFYYKTMYTLPQHVNEPKKNGKTCFGTKNFHKDGIYFIDIFHGGIGFIVKARDFPVGIAKS